jgi:hypothetical protein
MTVVVPLTPPDRTIGETSLFGDAVPVPGVVVVVVLVLELPPAIGEPIRGRVSDGATRVNRGDPVTIIGY